MATLGPIAFGVPWVLFGLIVLAWKPKEGNADYYLSVVPGFASPTSKRPK